MSDIRAGDVVVCVDASPCKSGCPSLCHELRVGRSYRVSYAGAGWLVPSGVAIGPHFAVAPARFRKISAADELFTEQMRNCRPAKQRVPAKARGESV